jgi:hypothetical protein
MTTVGMIKAAMTMVAMMEETTVAATKAIRRVR